jgi:sodium-dependent dicarboxylate transporter 2/3/5
VKIFGIQFPNAPEISFAKWLAFAFPISLVLFGITYFYLYVRFCPKRIPTADISMFRKQYEKLGPVKFEEVSRTFKLSAWPGT